MHFSLRNLPVPGFLIYLIAFSFLIQTSVDGNAQDTTQTSGIVKKTKVTIPDYQPLQLKLGFNLGWCFPYSGGLEFSLLFHELIDINAGVGIGISGFKYGGGARLYPMRDSKVSPMIGAFVFHAAGAKGVVIPIGFEDATYDITPETAFLINGGMRLRFGRGHFFTAAVGYIEPFEGDQAEYQRGSRERRIRNVADALSTSGLSVNFGLQLKISKGYY